MGNWRQPSKIRRQGREAYYAGQDRGGNPYLRDNRLGTIWLAESLADDWDKGWLQAQIQEAENAADEIDFGQ